MRIEKATLDRPIRMLVYGSPGVGKTTFGASAPKPLILDLEGGLIGALHRGYSPDRASLDSWKDIEEVVRLLDGPEGSRYDTLVIDSITEFQKLVMDAILQEASAREPMRDTTVISLREWGTNTERMRRTMRRLHRLPQDVIYVAQNRPDRDEGSGLTKNHPGMTQKFGEDLLAYVDVVLYVAIIGDQRVMAAQPRETVVAKDRSGVLPAVFEWQDANIVLDAIRGNATIEPLQLKKKAEKEPDENEEVEDG